ncbi:MAG TPA: hypothetical protein VJS14_07315 [Enterobacteriaceae bacterium]|nr:hypothetical protein [Enterobacteriaceae bacterium]
MKSKWIYLSLILGLAQPVSAQSSDTKSLTTEQKIERLRQMDPWRAEMYEGAMAWQQKDFVKAEAAGHRALEAAGTSSLRQQDALDLLAKGQEGQNKHAEARDTWKRLAALRLEHGDAYEAAMFRSQAVYQASKANEPAELTALQQSLVMQPDVMPSLWSLSTKDNTLLYRVAGIRLPLNSADWVMTSLTSPSERMEPAEIDYLATSSRATSLDINIGWREDADTHAADRQQQEEKRFASEDDLHLQMPKPEVSGAIVLSRASRDADGPVKADWRIIKDKWVIDIRTRFPADQREEALAQISRLWANIDWGSLPDIDGDRPMSQRLDGINSAIDQKKWQQAETEITRALKYARFPQELAVLHTQAVFASAGLQQSAKEKAEMKKAFAAWKLVKMSRYEEMLFNRLQEHAVSKQN